MIVPAAVLLALAACQDFAISGKSGFKGQYLAARGALESGSYDTAARAYQTLLKQSGPLAARVRLEYAHSLLRANRFEDAAREARKITATEQGSARLAALAVQGTADHETARAAMARGDTGTKVRSLLNAAKAALDEVLAKGKAFDPLGALAARRKILGLEIARL